MRKLREISRLQYEAKLPPPGDCAGLRGGAGTVSVYAQRALEAGRGSPLPEALDNAALEGGLFAERRHFTRLIPCLT